MTAALHIVFDGPPGSVNGRFVEVEALRQVCSRGRIEAARRWILGSRADARRLPDGAGDRRHAARVSREPFPWRRIAGTLAA